jgi:hypothetical protein
MSGGRCYCCHSVLAAGQPWASGTVHASLSRQCLGQLICQAASAVVPHLGVVSASVPDRALINICARAVLP